MRQKLYLRSSAFLVCVLLCLQARAQAQPSSTSDVCQSDSKCTELYQTASNLMKLEQNAAALALLQTAYAKYPAAWLLVHIGRAQQKLGRLAAAINSYRQFLASLETTTDPALTQKVQEYLQQAQSQVVDNCLSNPKCTELIELARSLSKTGQFEAALTLYQNAFAQFPAPWLLVNIGRAQQKLGQLAAAMTTYRQYLSSPDAEDDPELTRKAQEYLLQAESDFEPPPAPLEPPPPPPPPAPPARPVCPGEKEEPAGSPARPCERQKRRGFAISLGLSSRSVVVPPAEFSGAVTPQSGSSIGGVLFLGYKGGRVVVGLGAEVDYASGSTQLASYAGTSSLSTSTTSYLIIPTLQVAFLQALSGQLELFASAQLGLGQAITQAASNPPIPVTPLTQNPSDRFRLDFLIGPGVRHFFTRQFALTLLSGVAIDTLYATRDSPAGLRADRLLSVGLFGTLGALAVF